MFVARGYPDVTGRHLLGEGVAHRGEVFTGLQSTFQNTLCSYHPTH